MRNLPEWLPEKKTKKRTLHSRRPAAERYGGATAVLQVGDENFRNSHNNTNQYIARDRSRGWVRNEKYSHIYTDFTPPPWHQRCIEYRVVGVWIDWNKHEVTPPPVSYRWRELRCRSRRKGRDAGQSLIQRLGVKVGITCSRAEKNDQT